MRARFLDISELSSLRQPSKNFPKHISLINTKRECGKMVKAYSEYVRQIASKIPRSIIDLTQPRRRSRPPTQAFSEFATHREQGDWAETLVTQALSCLVDYDVVKCGKTDTIMAGEKGFKEFYERYQDELDTIGKRPDVLIFAKETSPKSFPRNISDLGLDQLSKIVPKALAGFEIRSSSFLSKKYKQAMQREGKTKGRTFLSFTPKVEDLLVVLKWIDTYNVPHYYVQVFFDAVYVIPFHSILQLISNSANEDKIFTIEKNEKNQQKTTIHLDIDQGLHLGDIVLPPEHYSAAKELNRGRMLYYVRFKGAKLEIKRNILNQVIKEAQQMAQGNFGASASMEDSGI